LEQGPESQSAFTICAGGVSAVIRVFDLDGHTFHPPEVFLPSAKSRIAFSSKISTSGNGVLKPGAGFNEYSINPMRLSWRL